MVLCRVTGFGVTTVLSPATWWRSSSSTTPSFCLYETLSCVSSQPSGTSLQGVCVCVSGRTDRGWVCDCSARRSSALYFGLNSGSLILEFIKHVRLCVSKGPMRTSTGSLVQSWCVAMVMCLAVCPRRRRRHLQRESNRHLSSSSDTCWIQRLRWRASSTNTGGRCLIHTSMQKHHKAAMQSLPLIFHLSQFVP